MHGLDRALGLRRSPLGGMVMVMGILGALTALLFQWWVSAVDYPLVTGGKAPSSWQAFVPIMFEVTVLFATFTAGLGMLLLLNRLPFFGHPVLQFQGHQPASPGTASPWPWKRRRRPSTRPRPGRAGGRGRGGDRDPAGTRAGAAVHRRVHPAGRGRASSGPAWCPGLPSTGG